MSASPKLPHISHTGGYQIAVGDADLIREDVVVNVLGSFFGVIALFLYGFRRPTAFLYAAQSAHDCFAMPADVALPLGSRQRVMLDIDTLNTGENPVQPAFALNVWVAPGATQHAGTLNSSRGVAVSTSQPSFVTMRESPSTM